MWKYSLQVYRIVRYFTVSIVERILVGDSMNKGLTLISYNPLNNSHSQKVYYEPNTVVVPCLHQPILQFPRRSCYRKVALYTRNLPFSEKKLAVSLCNYARVKASISLCISRIWSKSSLTVLVVYEYKTFHWPSFEGSLNRPERYPSLLEFLLDAHAFL